MIQTDVVPKAVRCSSAQLIKENSLPIVNISKDEESSKLGQSISMSQLELPIKRNSSVGLNSTIILSIDAPTPAKPRPFVPAFKIRVGVMSKQRPN